MENVNIKKDSLRAALLVVIMFSGVVLISRKSVDELSKERAKLDPRLTAHIHAEVPVSASAYLAVVTEPIQMVEGVRCDCPSVSLVFKDARGQEFSISTETTFENDRDWFEVPEQGGQKSEHREVIVGSAEEHAILRLLRRWYQNSASAQDWNRKLQSSDREVIRRGIIDQDGDLMAVFILRTMHDR